MHSNKLPCHHCSRLVLLFLIALVQASQPMRLYAGTYTWDPIGVPGGDLNTPGNWVGGVAPPNLNSTSNTAQDDLIFGLSVNTNVEVADNSNDNNWHSILFTNDAPAYTFRNTLYPVRDIDARPLTGGTPVNPLIQNDSNFIQTFTLTTDFAFVASGTMFGNAAGFDINSPFYISNNVSVTYQGAANSFINNFVQTGTGGGFRTTVTPNQGAAGIVTFRNDSPAFNKAVNIGTADTTSTAGSHTASIRIQTNDGLGPASSSNTTTGYTQIYGGAASDGRLELTNSITTGERIKLHGRANGLPVQGFNNALNPAILNVSGNNTLSGTVETIAGGASADFLNFGSASGTLTVANGLAVSLAGDRYLQFFGAGNGNFGNITGTGAATTVSVVQRGGGNLTLSGSANNSVGHVMALSGTVTLGANFTASSAFATISAGGLIPQYHVQGGTLNVSNLTGGLNLDRILSGSGIVTGSVAAAPGASIQPGSTVVLDDTTMLLNGFAAGAGTLSVSSNLDLSNSGHFVWTLASNSTADVGINSDLITVGGMATLGGSSTLDLDFSLLSGADPSSGNAFWTSNHSWKIVDTAGNSATTTFASISNGIFGAGSFSTSIAGGDVYLNYAAVGSTPGDFNGDSKVDGVDFGLWQNSFPSTSGGNIGNGDADGDGDVDGADFIVWQTHFPTPPTTTPVPEPTAGWMAFLAITTYVVTRGIGSRQGNRS